MSDEQFPTDVATFMNSFYENTKEDFITILWRKPDVMKLLNNHYPHLLETYNNYPKGIQRADFIRYIILHHYGGVYSDVDCSLTKPLRGVIAVTYHNGEDLDFLAAHELTMYDTSSTAHFPIRTNLPVGERMEDNYRVANYFMAEGDKYDKRKNKTRRSVRPRDMR